jgi:hypothetical protein
MFPPLSAPLGAAQLVLDNTYAFTRTIDEQRYRADLLPFNSEGIQP